VVRSTYCKSLINVVNEDKPKMLTPVNDRQRLEPKGKWPGPGVETSPDADVEPPADRRDLTHSGAYTKRGKPVALPVFLRESVPQGRPTGLRVWEDGGSKCRSLIGRIKVELRQYHLTRKRADFHLVSDHERV
jgi:hypothetical protein